MSAAERRKRLYALVLGIALVFTVVGAATFGDLGSPDVPDDAVAVVEDVDNGTVSQEEFDRAVQQAAASQGLEEPPPPDDPSFDALREIAMSSVLLSRWISGEAAERGVTVSESEVQSRFAQVQRQEGGAERFRKLYERAGFTREEAINQVSRLRLLGERIQADVVGPGTGEECAEGVPDLVDESDIETFYEQNREQFEQPETRDFRLILTEDEETAQEALAELGTAPTAEDWEAVAAELSTDRQTRREGGLRRNVAEGQSEPALDQQAFAAEAGALVGPFEGESGFYVIQVEEITPAETTPLEEIRNEICQQLLITEQQRLGTAFQEDFVSEWTARTFCADGFITNRCTNFEPPADSCQGDDEGEQGNVEETGCPTFVPPPNPIGPIQAGILGDQQAGLPQGPCAFADPAASPPELCDWPKAPPDPGEGGGAIPLGPQGAPPAPGAGQQPGG